MPVSRLLSCQAVFRAHEIRAIEHAAIAQNPAAGLMERAGIAAAALAADLLDSGSAVLVLAGPGNNGGDALVAARHLMQRWYRVTMVLAGAPERLPPDAGAALQAWRDAGGSVLDAIPGGHCWDLVVDGLFGIGIERDLSGPYLSIVKQVNQLAVPILSLDIPSGLDSETGQIFGAAVRADHTITFLGLKPGLFTAYGPDYCGRVHLATLDLPPDLLPPSKGSLIGEAEVAAYLKPRPLNSHKGIFGSVGILGGADGMIGAALLAGRAALKSGAGRVYLGMLAEDTPGVDQVQPELMLRRAEHLFELDLDCLVVGPGLGQSAPALGYLARALESPWKLVIDADALNLAASHPELQDRIQAREAPSVVTPHPAEAGRLLGRSSHEIQQDRIGAAQTLAGRLSSLVVLKGAGTVCARPDQSWHLNTSGNPGLSSAGMGDVLSGMIAAFAGQRLPLDRATLLAVYLHGAAADELVAEGIGPIGLSAGELTDRARNMLNRWVYGAPETRRR